MRVRSLLILMGAASVLSAADTEPRWVVLNRAAGSGGEGKDYGKLRDALRELQPLMPGNPRVVYNLACANAVLGNKPAALAGVRNLATMGLVYDFAADADLTSLRESGEFRAALKQTEENKKPVSHSSLAFALAERDLLPEDIAYDPPTRRFLVSSVHHSKIVTADGKEFAKADWPLLALRIDPITRFSLGGRRLAATL